MGQAAKGLHLRFGHLEGAKELKEDLPEGLTKLLFVLISHPHLTHPLLPHSPDLLLWFYHSLSFLRKPPWLWPWSSLGLALPASCQAPREGARLTYLHLQKVPVEVAYSIGKWQNEDLPIIVGYFLKDSFPSRLSFKTTPNFFCLSQGLLMESDRILIIEICLLQISVGFFGCLVSVWRIPHWSYWKKSDTHFPSFPCF